MQKIIPHLWFDSQAKEATTFYTSLFPDSRVNHVVTISNTPSGNSDIVTFTLAGQNMMAISAGPMFALNPSVSFFVVCNNAEEADTLWNTLAEGGKILMPYQAYPWATKYGWLQDKYGLSWQISVSEEALGQKITPLLMFTGPVAGKVKEAIAYYTSVFPNSQTDALVPYEPGEGDEKGAASGMIKHGRFSLNGQQFMAMDSSFAHAFGFNEAVSFVVMCDDQEEIDYYWEKLSAVPAAEQCGWLKDMYGVSWQIVPRMMNELMTTGDPEKTARVTQAFLKMKKFDIKKLQEAAG